MSVSQNGSEQFNIVKALEVEGQNTKSDVLEFSRPPKIKWKVIYDCSQIPEEFYCVVD